MGIRTLDHYYYYYSIFILLWIQGFTLLEAHDHSNQVEITTTRSRTDANLLPSLNCTADAECVVPIENQVENSTRILAICDNILSRCKCPVTLNGVHVISLNTSCILSHQIGDFCKNDAECTGNIPGSICSKEGACQCPHGGTPVQPGGGNGMAAVVLESCPTEARGFNEFSTLKWVFIFILLGYPIMTLLFAIFEKAKDDHWFYEKIASYVDCRKKHWKEKQKKTRRVHNRRNTEDDFVSTDDDESPLEMEIV